MTTTTRFVADEITADIHTAAYTIYRRYKQWVKFAELQRLVSWWVSEHPHIVSLRPRVITAILRRVAEQRARRIKAAKCGYHPDDEQFYSTRAIVRMLPYALDPNATPPAFADEDMAEISRHHSWEGYSGWETVLADIRTGLGYLTRRERNLLTLSYVAGMGTTKLARKLRTPTPHVRGELVRAVKRIQEVLGGPRPQIYGNAA